MNTIPERKWVDIDGWSLTVEKVGHGDAFAHIRAADDNGVYTPVDLTAAVLREIAEDFSARADLMDGAR